MTRPLTVMAVADSDSYVKWGAALLARAPSNWQRQLFVIATPVMPSEGQLAAALEGAEGFGGIDIVELADLAVRVRDTRPDVVLISVRGPLVKVIVRAVAPAGKRRPVIVTGLPGISIPATRMAVAHRAQADLFIVHSRREVDEFARLADRMGIAQKFALATLPFLPNDKAKPEHRGDIVFAAQAKVPEEKFKRTALLGWLADTARMHPERRVIIKVRAARGEQQTHAERHDYADLLVDLQPAPPSNLFVSSGPMSEHLSHAAGLVTVSSTAAIEAVALGVPVLALSDFGVKRDLINTVFAESGLLGDSTDLVANRFRHPQEDWLGDNYFHGVDADTWVTAVEDLVTVRETGPFPLKSLKRGVAGGRLRKAWDRKRSLGHFDKSFSGTVAVAVGTPAQLAFRVARRLLRNVRSRRAQKQAAE